MRYCQRCKINTSSRRNIIVISSEDDDLIFRNGDYTISLCSRCEDKLYNTLKEFLQLLLVSIFCGGPFCLFLTFIMNYNPIIGFIFLCIAIFISFSFILWDLYV